MSERRHPACPCCTCPPVQRVDCAWCGRRYLVVNVKGNVRGHWRPDRATSYCEGGNEPLRKHLQYALDREMLAAGGFDKPARKDTRRIIM